MKDLIFITAYCPTEEREIVLEKCIDSVLKCGKHIALISHSHIPIHIQKKCQYYVYDYNNEISEDHNLLGFNHFTFGERRIESKFINKTFYGFAIYRMFSIASQIAINFGYDNIHHIEYDCELLDETLIDKNSKLLEEYDSVIYTHNGQEDGFLFGSFKSFKVKTLPEYFKNYNKDFIYDEMKKIEPKQLESLTKKLFINSGKVFFQKELTSEKFKKGKIFFYRNLHFTLFYSDDGKLNLYYRSIQNCSEEIVVVINKTHVFYLEVKPKHWHTLILGNFNEIEHVRIYDSNKIMYDKIFDEELRDIYKKNSFIIDEKNN